MFTAKCTDVWNEACWNAKRLHCISLPQISDYPIQPKLYKSDIRIFILANIGICPKIPISVGPSWSIAETSTWRVWTAQILHSFQKNTTPTFYPGDFTVELLKNINPANFLKYCETSFTWHSNNKLFTAFSAVGNTNQIYFLIKNQKKKPALFFCGFKSSVLFLPSLLLLLLLLLSQCFQYYQRFHSFIPSTPLLCLICLSDAHTVTHTHIFTHMDMITWSHDPGYVTTLQGPCTTLTAAQRHTQAACVCPLGGAGTSAVAWCFISRTTHYYSNTSLFKCSYVLSILLNQLYMRPEGKHFTNTLLLWRNEMTFEWTHYTLIFFYSHRMCVFRISVRPFRRLLREYLCWLWNGADRKAYAWALWGTTNALCRRIQLDFWFDSSFTSQRTWCLFVLSVYQPQE